MNVTPLESIDFLVCIRSGQSAKTSEEAKQSIAICQLIAAGFWSLSKFIGCLSAIYSS
jgi:hypothetical protein